MAATSADLDVCEASIRTGSKSFYLASKLLPRGVRRDAYALYAFCRMADDSVDETHGGKGRVDALARRLDGIYGSSLRDDAIDRALASVIARHRLPRAVFDAMLDGFAWDASGRSYESLDELHDYGARVAGTVGVLMTLLMERRDAATLARACDLGAAMQLSNIARDVGEDARLGRMYLPRDWLRAGGIDVDQFLARPAFSPEIGAVVARLLDEADRLYDRARAGVHRLPGDCRWAISAAGRIYAAIGDQVARGGFDSVSRRARVSRARKLLLLGAARADSFVVARGAESPPLPSAKFLIDAVVS